MALIIIAVNQTAGILTVNSLSIPDQQIPASGSVTLTDFAEPQEVFENEEIMGYINDDSILINDGSTTLTKSESLDYITSTNQQIVVETTGATGLQGITGIQGLAGSLGSTGLQGIQGETGIQGPAGAGVNAFRYKFDSSTANSDPGSGFFRFDNSGSQELATRINIDVLEEKDSINVGNFFLLATVGSYVFAQEEADPNRFQVYRVLEDPELVGSASSGYIRFPSVESTASGSNLRDGNECLLGVGFTGESGATAVGFEYQANTTNQTDSDPGSGFIKWNNATQNSSTELFISETNSNGTDLEDLLTGLQAGDVLSLTSELDASQFQDFEITSITDNTDYVTFGVSADASAGGNFSNDQAIILTILRQGPQGVTGLQGVTGILGATGIIGPQGTQGNTGVGLTGSTGIQGIQGTQGDTGILGLTGSTGIEGIQGTQGDTGILGLTGSTGIQGIQGNTGIQGIQGATGIQGVTGIQGATGVIGSTGLPGSNPLCFNYLYSTTTTDSDPGVTFFRLNDTTLEDATQMYIDPISLNGNVSVALTTFGIENNILTLISASDPSSFIIYEILSDSVNAGGYIRFPSLSSVEFGSGFSNNEEVLVCFSPAGPQGVTGLIGSTGIQGVTGFLGSTGITAATGIQGVTGLVGVTGLIGNTGITAATGIQGITGLQGVTGLEPALGAITAYDSVGGQTYSTTAITVNLDATTEIDNTLFSLANDVITINVTGTYLFIAQVTAERTASTRGSIIVFVEENPLGGGSFTEITGSRGYSYIRNSAGNNTANSSFTLAVTATDEFRLRSVREIGVTVQTDTNNSSSLTIVRIA